MKLNFALGFIPVPTFVTENMPENTGAYQKFFWIGVRQKYIDSNDVGIIEHELKHIEQFYFFVFLGLVSSFLIWALLGLLTPVPIVGGCVAHQILYTFSSDYREYCEIEAYSEQLKHYQDDRTDIFAEFISRDYNLEITPEDAARCLRD